MFQIIRDSIFGVLKQFIKSEELKISKDEIFIDKPRDPSLGDLYTNAAMMFSKKLGVSPNVLAVSIRDSLLRLDDVVDVSIAGSGFVNFKLKASYWQKVIDRIFTKKEKYSFTNLYNGDSLNLEFVSANPTGPLHTGHARNAVLGSVIANLMEKIGYKVTKEFYINDMGNQIQSLAKSVYIRYKEILGLEIPDDAFTDDMYCGKYIRDIALEFISIYKGKFLNKPDNKWLDFFTEFTVKKMMKNIQEDLALLGVVMDKYTSETKLCEMNLIDEALAILLKNGDIYQGVLQKPKGFTADNDDWEERSQTLFKSTKYGDDVDRAIRKSDDSWTYFSGDLAYHLDKIKRGYSKMIAILGADHSGYTKRLEAAVKALSNGKSEIEIKLYQLVNFLENGKHIKMSKRAGTFITLKDVVQKVGKDVARYMMISRSHDAIIDFDFAKAIESSMENPIFYTQYAYARICSIFKNYKVNFGDLNEEDLENADKSRLVDDAEISLMRALSFWPDQVKSTALAIEPHRIPAYLQYIASQFHSLWNKGKINSELRFIDIQDKEETLSRISLLNATKIVIEDGLSILGIAPMSEMR